MSRRNRTYRPDFHACPQLELLEKRWNRAGDFDGGGIAGEPSEDLAPLFSQWTQAPVTAGLGTTKQPLQSQISAVTGFDPRVPFEAEVVHLFDGSHVFIFSQIEADAVNIYARQTQSDGQPGSPPFLVQQLELSTLGSQNYLRMRAIPLANDSFAFFYSDVAGIHGQRYSLLGEKLGDSVHNSLAIGQDNPYFDVVALRDGSFVSASLNQNQDIVFHRFGGPGQLSTDELLSFAIGQAIDRLELHPTLNADFGISWIVRDEADFASPWDFRHFYREVTGSQLTLQREIVLTDLLTTPGVYPRSDGSLVVLGFEAADAANIERVVKIVATDGSILSRTLLSNETSLDADHLQIAVHPDGHFAVSGFSLIGGSMQFVANFFNRDGSLIGEDYQINETPLSTVPLGGIIPLASGGFAAYWTSPTESPLTDVVMTRTIRLATTPLYVAARDSKLATTVSLLEIEGVPAELGLDRGERLAPTRWRLPVSELGGLRIVGMSKLPSLRLTFTIHGVTGYETEPFTIFFGTAAAESITAEATDHHFDGREGDDVVVLDALSTAARVQRISEHSVVLADIASLTAFVLEEVEYVEFIDQVLSIDELIEQTEIALDIETPEEIAPTVPPVPNIAEISFEPPMASVPDLVLITQALQPPSAGEALFDRIDSLANSLEISQSEAAGDSTATDEPSADESATSDEPTTIDATTATENAVAVDVEEVVIPAEAVAPAVADPSVSVTVNNQVEQPNFATTPTQIVSANPAIVASANQGNGRISNPPPAAPVTRDQGVRFTTPALAIAPAFDSSQLFEEFDAVEESVAAEKAAMELIVGSAVIVAAGFSVAQVVWLLRGSLLLTKLLSSMPIWIAFDPLPILNAQWRSNDSVSDTNESLLDIVSV